LVNITAAGTTYLSAAPVLLITFLLHLFYWLLWSTFLSEFPFAQSLFCSVVFGETLFVCLSFCLFVSFGHCIICQECCSSSAKIWLTYC
jgi:hypothetical protein